MYIGRIGDGSQYEDGIYILLKEVVDNAIDEFIMGHVNTIEVTVEEGAVTVRDYGRGIPLGKAVQPIHGNGGALKHLIDDNFLQYASYVIRDRAIPDLKDGLKPGTASHSLFPV